LRYVLDCSVALKWFVPEEDSDRALALLTSYQGQTVDFVSVDTVHSEFGHALRSAIRRDRLDVAQARHALQAFLALPLPLVPSRLLAPAALDLAIAHHTTFYDALYMALAIREDAPVLTADERTATAFAPLDRTVLLRDLDRLKMPR
jgi:predicted nucleic acid-binding protein